MSKTIILGDTHGTSFWKLITHIENPDRVIFIGDYFDSFEIKTEEQCNNFLDIIEYKKTSGKDVILLIGNHDYHYIVGENGTSGYQTIGKLQIEPIIKENLNHLQIAYQFDNFLCTHAGVSEVFLNEVFGKDGWSTNKLADDLNELFKYKPFAYLFNGYNNTGDDIQQTPIWIRPKSLIASSPNISKDLIQIVGHTTYSTLINFKDKYYFIDTLKKSGQYLIIKDNDITINSI